MMTVQKAADGITFANLINAIATDLINHSYISVMKGNGNGIGPPFKGMRIHKLN